MLRPMLVYARTKGVDTEAILREIGVEARALDEYDVRISETVRLRAWELAQERADDPLFGLHAAEHAATGAFDVLDYAVYFSSTLGEGIDRLLRFHRLLCDAWDFRLTEEGDSMRLRRTVRTPHAEQEAALALFVQRARELTGKKLAPHEVRFTYGAAGSKKIIGDFFDCPVHFECAWPEIVFGRAALALPIRSANDGVVRVLDRYMRDLLARLPADHSHAHHAASVVSRAMCSGQRPTLDTVAHAMRASRRTVQRRLGDEGTSFDEVVDETRRELAERLISDRRLSITEITFLLGFEDVSGFRRAYKRWTGLAPSHRRRQLSGHDGHRARSDTHVR
jgi:AraC-like DNA-binding protein